ncbi:putative peptidase S1, PA clan [Plasmopara halstedii]
MCSHVMALIWPILLFSLLSLPVRVYVNVSLSSQDAGYHHSSQAADATVILHPLNEKEWRLYPKRDTNLSILTIVQPGAHFIAVNFKRLDLLLGDKLIVRDPDGLASVSITANTSTKVDLTNTSPSSVLLRTHPFLIKGDQVVVEYFPSVSTLVLPLSLQPSVVLASYIYVLYNSSVADVDTESTVGVKDEAKEAICYQKTEPKMYAKARAVARLMICNDQRGFLKDNSEQVTSWAFCTGWILGQGNYLITNHHCMKDAVVATEVDDNPLKLLSKALNRLWPHTRSPANKTGRIVEAVVSFMAETKSCQETGYIGENVGVVEATKVSVLAENPVLDYALLRVLTNESTTDLAKRYGSLRLRVTGPVDGEAIYIPQHPRVLAASNDSSDFLRHEASVIQPIVEYNADTEPGSSGSPVLSQKDNTVVALHRAGSFETLSSTSSELYNIGVRADFIARDLKRRKVLPKNSLVC